MLGPKDCGDPSVPEKFHAIWEDKKLDKEKPLKTDAAVKIIFTGVYI